MKFRVAGICAALAVLAFMVLLLVRPELNGHRIRPLVYLVVAWMAFAVAAWLVRKVPLRVAVGLVLAGGIAIQVAAVSAPPQNSTDLYRYIWDGQVQAAGIDPYAFVPADRRLTFLRDDFLWGHGAWSCVPAASVRRHDISLAGGCTKINRPTVPTIYPPVAEAYFHAAHYLPGETKSTLPIQAAGAGFGVLTSVLLLFGLRRLGGNMRLAALWSWCPTVALEAGNNAHVDVVAVALSAAALLLLATASGKRRTVAGGVLLGLAIGTKFTPGFVLPAVLRRRWMLVSASVLSAVAVVYVPHVLAVGGKVIGFIPGYLQEEGYNSGRRFGLISLFLTGKAATLVAMLLLAVVAALVFWFADPDRPWRGAVVMTGAALAVTTPHYQWYALLLVMLVALDGRPEWLAFSAGGYYAVEPDLGRFTPPAAHVAAIGYGLPLLFVSLVSGWRYLKTQQPIFRPAPSPVLAAIPAPAGDQTPADDEAPADDARAASTATSTSRVVPPSPVPAVIPLAEALAAPSPASTQN